MKFVDLDGPLGRDYDIAEIAKRDKLIADSQVPVDDIAEDALNIETAGMWSDMLGINIDAADVRILLNMREICQHKLKRNK